MRWPPYPAYKPSGVEWLGDVPVGWEVKRGRFCMDVNPRSKRLRELRPEDEVSFVPMEAVGEYGGIFLGQTRTISDVGSGYTEFDDGDVVVAKITPCFENGKGALAAGLFNGVAFGTTELHVLRVSSDLDRRFLFYFTISRPFRQTGEGEMYGAGGQKRVPPEFCENFPLPLPGTSEQTTIANFLDRETGRIDTLVAKNRTLIERLKEKRTALISALVTGKVRVERRKTEGQYGTQPDESGTLATDSSFIIHHSSFKTKPSGVEWLGEVPEEWDIAKFSKEVRIAEGQVDPESEPYCSMILVAPNHIESGTGRLLALETATDQAAISGKYLCAYGEVIYSKIRPALAKATLAPADCLCSADMYPMMSKGRLQNRYLLLLLLSSQFTAWSRLEADRVAMPKVNRETLNDLRLPVPTLLEQTTIADFLDAETSKIDTLIAKVETTIERLLEYRTALITAAVTGNIDVRGAVG